MGLLTYTKGFPSLSRATLLQPPGQMDNPGSHLLPHDFLFAPGFFTKGSHVHMIPFAEILSYPCCRLSIEVVLCTLFLSPTCLVTDIQYFGKGTVNYVQIYIFMYLYTHYMCVCVWRHSNYSFSNRIKIYKGNGIEVKS